MELLVVVKYGLLDDLDDVEESVTGSLHHLGLLVFETLKHWVEELIEVLLGSFLIQCDRDHGQTVETSTPLHRYLVRRADVILANLSIDLSGLILIDKCLNLFLELKGGLLSFLQGLVLKCFEYRVGRYQ